MADAWQTIAHMSNKQRKTDRVTIRMTREQRKMLKRASNETGKDEGEFVRNLVIAEVEKIASLKGWKAA
jgi:uncharacterized protein (DUF1778 family)